MTGVHGPVIIEAALNGGRGRAEHPGVPYTAAQLAAEARRCVEAGATVVHVHARDDDGGWTADPARYAQVVRAVRKAVPDVLISITSIRPAGVPVDTLLDLLEILTGDPFTRPDLISVNLGHIVAWEPAPERRSRQTVHFPNAYEEIASLLAACARHDIRPELGLMDLGFISNAVALLQDGRLPPDPWFLIELDSPAYGAGAQVAPATVANYEALTAALREQIPAARWAAHGQGIAGYAVIGRALADGAHARVGFEDAIHLPDGRLAASNADQVTWAISAARRVGREPASYADARAILGCA